MKVISISLFVSMVMSIYSFSLRTLQRRSVHRPLRTSVLLSSTADYDHETIEPKWQRYWDENEVFKATRRPGHPKKYILDMFPYPSGSGLHVGHPEGYTATDIMSRYWRMKDYDVLHPMGWDAFGLPAEQHAINTGTHPSITTYKNIATFKRQLKSLGFSYDWSREISTTDEGYVKWTQWIFLQLFKAGLAFQSEISVNWCPALGTVLANEEIIDGLSERGGHPVVRQPLRQWILKITDFADKLEAGLENLNWPEGTMSAQKQWIGRSLGASISFKVNSSSGDVGSIEVFTTRPDTLMGVTYLVLAPENSMVKALTTEAEAEKVQKYVLDISGKSDLERTATGKEKGRTGAFTGSYAFHPVSGERVPIWIADYVLAGYGTGAVMAVPAHDDRDFAFASTFDLPVKQVVVGVQGDAQELPIVDEGVTCNSGEFDGLTTAAAKEAVIKKLEALGAGGKKVTYKLRDWVFSRQRYWGEPIPIYFPVEFLTDSGTGNPINGDAHRVVYEIPIPVDESDLPLPLPNMTDFHPGDDPQGCLARAKEWRYFQKDGKWFARETNTMPQWAGSCWYYLRFADPTNEKNLIGKEASSWLPVDLYVGGQEHAVLHLLYARFWHKVLFDIGVVDHPEPFLSLVHQGMILGADGEKMSKSRGNVINPDDVVKSDGADALRLYEMFMGPLEATKPWQTQQLAGVVRFRDRVFALLNRQISDVPVEGEILRAMHKTIKKATMDVERLCFNTVISNLMIFTSTLSSLDGPIPREAYETLVLLLSPFAPHVAEEIWERLGHRRSISQETWPSFDEALCIDTTAVVAVQVNGKVRATIEIEVNLPEEQALAAALGLGPVAKHTDGMKINKVIYVPGKILNLVVSKK